MQINYWAVIVCAVASMVLGAIWYGPMFGAAWMRVLGLKASDVKKRKEMQKRAAPLYFLQFILSLFQIWVLSTYMVSLGLFGASGVMNALWIFGGFVLPTIAGTCMWTNDSREVAWTRFGIQIGYQLVCFVMFGLILGFWQ